MGTSISTKGVGRAGGRLWMCGCMWEGNGGGGISDRVSPLLPVLVSTRGTHTTSPTGREPWVNALLCAVISTFVRSSREGV